MDAMLAYAAPLDALPPVNPDVYVDDALLDVENFPLASNGRGDVLSFKNPHTLSLSIRAKALVFEDPRSRELEARLARLAPTDANLLIRGATGTGKELVARYVHARSRRVKKPFLAVNCGAIAANLIEAELFGHERGAFTDAIAPRAGWFEAANGGTLFLDEIGDLPLGQQVKLLRVLQEREVVRVGSRRPVPIDVRLIAATNVDLEEAVAAGRFREDLYYRLKVAMIHLPPLAERPGDIPVLLEHFIRYYAQRLSRDPLPVAPAALEKLVAYPWLGNIRELENAVHHALIVCPDKAKALNFEDFGLSCAVVANRCGTPGCGIRGLEAALQEICASRDTGDAASIDERIEKAIVTTVFEFCAHNQSAAARLLGVTRNVMRTRLARFGFIEE
ncbi:MAG: sigma 54-interacting transcriptional regulator [Zoogloeaceae bacterium]|nr:sigma 54-interacting transcriptional regulator [Zoogloeaceae bacterium]